jgi:hypothetical protein
MFGGGGGRLLELAGVEAVASAPSEDVDIAEAGFIQRDVAIEGVITGDAGGALDLLHRLQAWLFYRMVALLPGGHLQLDQGLGARADVDWL